MLKQTTNISELKTPVKTGLYLFLLSQDQFNKVLKDCNNFGKLSCKNRLASDVNVN